MQLFDEANHDKVRALEDLLNGDRALGWQHYNNLITDHEFVEAIRAVLGDPDKPAAGMTDRNTGLMY